MRHEILTRSRRLLFLGLWLIGVPSTVLPVVWNGNVSSNVVDDNIQITGNVFLQGGISVQAQTQNIVVTMSPGLKIISGNSVANQPRLYLQASPGRKITFVLTDDLYLQGAVVDNQVVNMLTVASGGGTVEFQFAGNQSQLALVNFFGTDPNGNVIVGGSDFYTYMDSTIVDFRRTSSSSAVNHALFVDSYCHLGYLASDNSGIGLLKVDGANSGTGDMQLIIQDAGSFVISGRYAPSSTPTYDQINHADLAGGVAQFLVYNGLENQLPAAPPARLQVLNRNTVYPTLFANPFCQDLSEFDGFQTGFIVGARGSLAVANLAYIEYVGLASNQAIFPDIPESVLLGRPVTSVVKPRNGSALIVDGGFSNESAPASIQLLGSSSAIYFLSGVDSNGNQENADFTVSSDRQNAGIGNFVFDVEAPVNVFGTFGGQNGLEILSLQIAKSGCPVFVEGTATQFPSRTFLKEDGSYVGYNKAAFLINNRLNLDQVGLIHTDENNSIVEKSLKRRPDISSQPAYIGGDTFQLCPSECPLPRPTISFNNSSLRLNTSAAFTGLDLRVPNNGPVGSNSSQFIFYYNGRCIDDGFGRFLVLGTLPGSTAEDGVTVIDKNAHLDIRQDEAQSVSGLQKLSLRTAPNSSCVVEGISSPLGILNQFSVQTIYLGNSSNISVGTEGDIGITDTCQTFSLVTNPTLSIEGDFFNFETRGGTAGAPSTAATTGEGGIFVDRNGTITIDCSQHRASFATMVAKSRNGIINLPKRCVYFDSRIGITDVDIDLSIPDQRTIVGSNDSFSDFIFDWGTVKKACNAWVPYEPVNTPQPCNSPAVVRANIDALPVVEGEVDQFQILRSRLGDMANIKVRGGTIRELIFQSGFFTSNSPMGFVVLEGDCTVGLGSAGTSADSVNASVVLGINGVVLCANGDGVVTLNSNLLINNVCHILAGPDFGVARPQRLSFFSSTPTELRVKSTGILDLTSFTNPNQILEFSGSTRLVLEPGAKIAMNGGILKFIDESNLLVDIVDDIDALKGTQYSDTNQLRSKLVGTGTVIFQEGSSMSIFQDGFFGIESDVECGLNTNIEMQILDQARVEIGNSATPGGAFQVGNVCGAQNAGTVRFSLVMDGQGALFEINRQGFLGFGVGTVNKAPRSPNEWQVGCLDGANISIDIRQGTFKHAQIVSGFSNTASLLAVGPGVYTYKFNSLRSRILGGGNLVLIKGQSLPNTCFLTEEPAGNCPASIFPVVADTAGQSATEPRLVSGLFASADQQLDFNLDGLPSVNVTNEQFYSLVAMAPNGLYASPKAAIASNNLGVANLAFINGSAINRQESLDIFSGPNAAVVPPSAAVERGAVSINIESSTQDVIAVIELQGAPRVRQ